MNGFMQYFENVKSIFTENGAWYRIITMMIIAIIYNIGSSFAFPTKGSGKPELPTEFNIPLLLLVILLAILISGYTLQVYSNRMNQKDNLIPKIDFLKMFICGIKAIPFYIVWSFYFLILFLALGVICGILGAAVSALRPLFMLIGIVSILVIIPAWYSVVALFAKDYKYKGHLSPMILFDMIPKTLLQIYAASFAAFLSMLGLVGVGCLLVVPFFKNYMSMQPEILFVLGAILLIALIYIGQVLGYAFNCTVADITLEEMDDNYAPLEDNNEDYAEIEYPTEPPSDDDNQQYLS